MFDVDINLTIVLFATASALIVGYIWYGPLLFGKAWMRLVDKNEVQLQQGAGKSYIGALASHFIMAYVLAHFINYIEATNFIAGMQTGLWLWIGFVATTHLINSLFQGKDSDLLIIDLGYHLVNLIIMGGIIAQWS